jgi:SAM-dependent methyltransferase
VSAKVYEFISKLFRAKDKPPTPGAAADHWSKWQAQVDEEKPKWIDWGDHPTFLDLIYEDHFGAKDITLFHYLQRDYPFFSDCNALSLCSGDGAFESLLSRNNIFGKITGVDISEYRVQKAVQEHASLDPHLDFIVGDINQGRYGENKYDVVFAKAALHHIENLEAAFAGILGCLKPAGYLVTIDFFGPTRFQWTDAQLEYANTFLHEIPENLRICREGKIKSSITRPTIQEMIDADPSEAVRSAEIYKFIQDNFNILNEFALGGPIFNLIFTSEIINNFDPDDLSHQHLIKNIYRKERELIASGVLFSDFKFIIAQKR